MKTIGRESTISERVNKSTLLESVMSTFLWKFAHGMLRGAIL